MVNYALSVGNFQIDNQLVHTSFPVLLGKPAIGQGVEYDPAQPWLSFDAQEVLGKDVRTLNGLTLIIQPRNIEVEEEILNRVYALFISLPQSQDTTTLDSALEVVPLMPDTLLDQQGWIYLRKLLIKKIQLVVSFETRVMDKADKPLSGSIGFPLPSITEFHLDLHELEKEHLFEPRQDISTRLQAFYVAHLIRQCYQMLAHLEILGDPGGLVRSFGQGFKLLGDNKTDTNRGSAFARTYASGITRTTGKILQSTGKGLELLTMNPEFRKKRMKEREQHKIKDAKSGLKAGGKDLARGVLQGLTGVVMDPVRAVKADGPRALGKGIAQGLVGVAIKPVLGVVDAAGHTAEGMHQSAALKDRVSRIRPPISFHADKVLRPYDEKEAFGNYLLKRLKQGLYQEETFKFFQPLPNGNTVLISSAHLFVLDTESQELETKFNLLNILALQRSKSEGLGRKSMSGIAVTLQEKEKQKSDLIPVCPLADAQGVRLIDALIGRIQLNVEAAKREVKLSGVLPASSPDSLRKRLKTGVGLDVK